MVTIKEIRSDIEMMKNYIEKNLLENGFINPEQKVYVSLGSPTYGAAYKITLDYPRYGANLPLGINAYIGDNARAALDTLYSINNLINQIARAKSETVATVAMATLDGIDRETFARLVADYITPETALGSVLALKRLDNH
jgi:hypothetical protein